MSSKVAKIYFNFETEEWEGISVEQVKKWEEAFPNCDVVDILTKKMPLWLTNPDNAHKAHKKKWNSFIINWLSRQEERYSQFNRR